MKNRPAIRLLMPLALLLATGLVGCKKSTVSPAGTAGEGTSETEQILAEIRKVQEATGSDLRALAAEVKRQQALQTEKAGDPPVVRDLAVLRVALGEARQAIQAKDSKVTEAALSRMERAALVTSAELPAAVVAQHVDRALTHIRQQEAAGSTDFVAASLSLLAASEAAVNGRPADLVPDVLNELDAAKASLDAGNTAEARKSLAAVLEKTTGHPSTVVMSRTRLALAGAREALLRQAWPVVEAELTEVESRLQEILGSAAQEAKTAASTDKQPAPKTSESGAAPPTTAEPQKAPASETAPSTAPAQESMTPASPPAQTTPAPEAGGAATPAGSESGSKGGLGRLFGR
ncbi:MAG: hypothetical protein HPY69_14850 [Armatimonadetes bacterium]|nr:hypothetical protein [Armatimonadota bacterium]